MREIKISSLTSSLFIKKLMMSGCCCTEIARCLKETLGYVYLILNEEIRMTTTQVKKIEKKFDLRFELLIREKIKEDNMSKAGKKLIKKLDEAIKEHSKLDNI